VRIGDDEADSSQAAADHLTQELEPELVVLGRPDIDSHDFPLSRGTNPDRDQHRHRDHPAVLPDLLEGGVQEQVRELAVEAPGAEGVDLGVELLADAADLVFGDALDAQRLGQVVDRPGRHAMDVGLLHHREQRPLMPAARLEQTRKVAARPQLGNVELDGADPSVPLPVSVAVAIGGPAGCTLVRLGADQLGHLGLHQLLRQQPHAIAQEVRVRALLRLVEQVQQCHPEIRHRCGPPCGA